MIDTNTTTMEYREGTYVKLHGNNRTKYPTGPSSTFTIFYDILINVKKRHWSGVIKYTQKWAITDNRMDNKEITGS